MKICLIGNSHLAALKMGWPEIAQEFPDVQPAFFGARGTMMSRLRVRGDRLVAKTVALSKQMSFVSGGLTEIVPDHYDAIILCGLALHVPRLPAGTSLALRRCAAADYVTNSFVSETLRKLRAVTDKTLGVAPSPLIAAARNEIDSPMMEYGALLDDLHRALDTPQTVMLGQPDGTWTANLTTRSMYSEGSLRLPTAAASAAKERHDDDDRKHMNAAFGSLWLRQNLARMAAA